jgi:phosphatidate cytidylyltransferase
MTLYEIFFAVLGSLVLLFGSATAIGSYLAARTIDPARLAWIGNLNSRIRSAWSIVVLFALAFALGGGAIVVVFAVASFFALREFVALTPIKPSDHWALVLAFYVVIPLQYLWVYMDWYGMYAVFIPVYVFLVLPVVMALRQDTELYLQRVAKVQWGLMISVFCVSHAPAIVSLELHSTGGEPGGGALLLLFFLLVLQASDLLAMVGSSFMLVRDPLGTGDPGTARESPGGRVPLRSNPDKCREGVLLGGAIAVLLGTCLWWMTPFTPWQAALMSLAIVVTGFMGSLVLASVKRSLGAHDVYEGMPLSRGVLARLDGLSFAAPAFFHLKLYFFGG